MLFVVGKIMTGKLQNTYLIAIYLYYLHAISLFNFRSISPPIHAPAPGVAP